MEEIGEIKYLTPSQVSRDLSLNHWRKLAMEVGGEYVGRRKLLGAGSGVIE